MNAWMHLAGWVLVHFVWQGVALAIVGAVVLHACRRHSATVRYAIACGALVAMLSAVLATAALVDRSDGHKARAQTVRVLIARERPNVAALPIQLDTRPPSMPRAFSSADVESLFPWVVSTWLVGVTLLLARYAAAWWRVRGLHQLASQTVCSAWQATGNRIAARLGLDGVIRIVELAHIDVPFVIGCLRPIVVLPISVMSQLNVAQVEAILAHEFAHVRRHDYLVNLLQTLAETLLFYHPAVWWISTRIRDEREHCCDDVALRVCGDPVSYASALTEIESWRIGQVGLAPGATSGTLAQSHSTDPARGELRTRCRRLTGRLLLRWSPVRLRPQRLWRKPSHHPKGQSSKWRPCGQTPRATTRSASTSNLGGAPRR